MRDWAATYEIVRVFFGGSLLAAPLSSKSVLGDGHLIFTEIIAPSKINSLAGSENAKSLPHGGCIYFCGGSSLPLCLLPNRILKFWFRIYDELSYVYQVSYIKITDTLRSLHQAAHLTDFMAIFGHFEYLHFHEICNNLQCNFDKIIFIPCNT